MQGVSTILIYLAAAGAIASWVAGAVFSARTLAAMPGNRGMMWLTPIAWPLALARIKGAGPGPAALVNKALVAFIACMLVGFAAFSASTNLHRFAK
jgi:hypothetical protein